MINGCIYIRKRSKKGQMYFYCIKKRAVIDFSCCKCCSYKEYKKASKMVAKKPLNKVSKTNKLSKATAITKNVKMIVWERDNHCCIFCGKPVEWNLANSHYIKRSHSGLGIEENIMTNCARCHSLFEESEYREQMKEFAKKYLMNKYDHWNEDMLVYKKRGIENEEMCILR